MNEPVLSERGPGAPDAAARKKRLIMIGGGGAVVLVLAAGYLLFSGGSSSNSAGDLVPVHHFSPSPVASAPSSASPLAGTGAVPAAYAGAAGRNPFSPLVATPKASASGAGTAATTAPTVAPTPSSVIPSGVVVAPVIPTPQPTVTVTATPSNQPAPLPSGNQTLVLTAVDAANGVATVTVNGTTYQPKTGKVFAKYFKLVSVLSGTDAATNQPTYGADFQYGDQFVQLAVGQSAAFSG